MNKSSLALGNLRGFAILMVVAFHAFIAYLGSRPAAQPSFSGSPYEWTANPIIDSERWFGFDLFCALQYVYLMHLMFFLSGLFVWPSIGRKGSRRFLLDRFLRLGAPFLIGVYLLMPLTYYPVYRVSAVDPSWSAYWSQWLALPFWPSGPMWFLWLLLAFNIVVAVLHRFARGTGELLGRLSAGADARPGRFFVGLVTICAVLYLPLSAVFEPWQYMQFGPFAFQPSAAPQYAVFFFAGMAVGAHGLERGLLAADGRLAARWTSWLAGAGAAFLMWIIPTALIVKGNGAALPAVKILADLGYVLSSAAMCFALAAVFLRFAAVPRAMLASLSQHAYGIYFFHYLFVLWIQYLLLGAAMFAVVKAAIVFAGTLLLSWATTVALCRIPIGARLVGPRRSVLARTR